MPRNEKGDGKKKGKKRGCPRCGGMRASSGKWCLCNGFRADGSCVVCGKKRVEGYKKPDHPTISRRGRNGRTWQVTACWADKKTFGYRNHQRSQMMKNESQKYQTYENEVENIALDGCFDCGCIRHVDEYGDRVCWCDSCDRIDWEKEWRPIWNADYQQGP